MRSSFLVCALSSLIACSNSQPPPPATSNRRTASSATPASSAAPAGSATPAGSAAAPAGVVDSGTTGSAASPPATTSPSRASVATPGEVSAAIEGDPPRFIARVTHGATSKVVVDVAAPADRWDEVTAEVSEVAGSAGRVILAQKLSQVGEDELSRDIDAWVIDATRDEVLWTGHGTYSNSFDECESLDVPEPAVENGVLVVRVAQGTEKLVARTRRCKAVRVKRTVVARTPLR